MPKGKGYKKKKGGVKKTSSMADQMREKRERASKGGSMKDFEKRLRELGFGSRKKK
jgi:hypothetical protein